MSKRLLIGLGIILVAGLITVLSLLFAQNAVAGQTSGFAPYARQGIENQLIKIYGRNGIPYTVTCTDVSHFPFAGNLVDTVTCKIRLK